MKITLEMMYLKKQKSFTKKSIQKKHGQKNLIIFMNNKFKIVVPSYNNEKWIETNIESIKEQNYANFEVLYWNNSSSIKLIFISEE